MKTKNGKLLSVKEVTGLKLKPVAGLNGKGGRLGFSQMINNLSGYGEKDGWEIKTEKHTYHILIDNGQSCCENWGYIVSDEDFSKFIGKELSDVRMTDVGLDTKMADLTKDVDYGGGVQFVDFMFTDNTVIQFAVYNAHNGYYGHDIIFARDNKILLNEVL